LLKLFTEDCTSFFRTQCKFTFEIDIDIENFDIDIDRRRRRRAFRTGSVSSWQQLRWL